MKKYFVEIIFSMKRNNGIIWILLALCSLCFFGEKVFEQPISGLFLLFIEGLTFYCANSHTFNKVALETKEYNKYWYNTEHRACDQ